MSDDPHEITADDERIRDLGHLAFIHGPPEQPRAITGYDVALVRGGRIAVLYTLVNTGG